MSIVIISEAKDPHLPFVTKHLKYEPVLIDFQAIADKGNCSYAFNDSGLHLVRDGQTIDTATGVWLRRPLRAQDLELPVDIRHRQYAESALKEFTDTFFALFPDSVWVSDYYALLRAKNKPLQQAVARALGFSVPATLYTTDAAEARRFCQAYQPFVVKSLATYFPRANDGGLQAFYSRLHHSPTELSFGGLNLAPAIFQQAIDVGQEFRVTVVGEQVFGAAIIAKEPDGRIRDWRYSQLHSLFDMRPTKLPEHIERLCIRLAQKLGLQFGAIDIIKDKAGTYWFLEINPNGQWVFVEEATGQPIGRTLARLLEGG